MRGEEPLNQCQSRGRDTFAREQSEVRNHLCNLKYKCATSLCILIVLLLEAGDTQIAEERESVRCSNMAILTSPDGRISNLFHLAEIMYPLLWQVTEAYFSFMCFFRCMVMVINVLVTAYVWL